MKNEQTEPKKTPTSSSLWVRTGIAVVVAAVAAIGFNIWRGAYDAPAPVTTPRPATHAAPPPAYSALPPPETLAAVFAPCAHCHEIGSGAHNMTGPVLTGVIGRPAASLPGYPYSDALRKSGIVWNRSNLARFIANPQDLVPGTRMMFAGLPKPQIDQIVDYVAAVGHSPAPPTAAKATALPSDTLQIGGPFHLVDTHGKPVTEADLLGKPSAIFFGYLHCPDVCPTTLQDLTDLMKKLGPAADKLNVVFISVDPTRDTPAALADYLSSFDPRIQGFTGTEAEVAQAAKAWHVFYRKVPDKDGGYSMDHTATVFLMDAKGHFVGTMMAEEDQATDLAKLKRLLAGAS